MNTAGARLLQKKSESAEEFKIPQIKDNKDVVLSVWSDNLGRAGSRAAQLLLILTVVSVAVFALSKVTLVVIPILIALILATAIYPVVRWLTHKGLPFLWATMLSFVGLLIVSGGVIAGIILAVKNEWSELAEKASTGFSQISEFAKTGPLPLDEKMLTDVQNLATDFLKSSSFSHGAISGISAAGSFFAGLVLMIVILFFFLKDGSQMWNFFLSFLKGERREKAALSGVRAVEMLGGYVRGTSAVAAIDAVVIGGALVFLGVPLALPLAVLTFIGGFIPLVGATAAGALAMLVALVSNGPVTALIVLAVVIVVNQLEGNFLQPVLMGNALKIHGLVIMLALTVGAILAGVIGAVLAVPLTAVGWAVIKVWRNSENEESTKKSDDANSGTASF
jgi:predicted PurR-regulated permease PerM